MIYRDKSWLVATLIAATATLAGSYASTTSALMPTEAYVLGLAVTAFWVGTRFGRRSQIPAKSSIQAARSVRGFQHSEIQAAIASARVALELLEQGVDSKQPLTLARTAVNEVQSALSYHALLEGHSLAGSQRSLVTLAAQVVSDVKHFRRSSHVELRFGSQADVDVSDPPDWLAPATAALLDAYMTDHNRDIVGGLASRLIVNTFASWTAAGVEVCLQGTHANAGAISHINWCTSRLLMLEQEDARWVQLGQAVAANGARVKISRNANQEIVVRIGFPRSPFKWTIHLTGDWLRV